MASVPCDRLTVQVIKVTSPDEIAIQQTHQQEYQVLNNEIDSYLGSVSEYTPVPRNADIFIGKVSKNNCLILKKNMMSLVSRRSSEGHWIFRI